ncbi:hypothetical protein M0R72_21520 [Candidatus Pacearchaeota archaeon]|nr:hypothetical protein [Candidatus Pacearchaeota archaeon]
MILQAPLMRRVAVLLEKHGDDFLAAHHVKKLAMVCQFDQVVRRWRCRTAKPILDALCEFNQEFARLAVKRFQHA